MSSVQPPRRPGSSPNRPASSLRLYLAAIVVASVLVGVSGGAFAQSKGATNRGMQVEVERVAVSRHRDRYLVDYRLAAEDFQRVNRQGLTFYIGLFLPNADGDYEFRHARRLGVKSGHLLFPVHLAFQSGWRVGIGLFAVSSRDSGGFIARNPTEMSVDEQRPESSGRSVVFRMRPDDALTQRPWYGPRRGFHIVMPRNEAAGTRRVRHRRGDSETSSSRRPPARRPVVIVQQYNPVSGVHSHPRRPHAGGWHHGRHIGPSSHRRGDDHRSRVQEDRGGAHSPGGFEPAGPQPGFRFRNRSSSQQENDREHRHDHHPRGDSRQERGDEDRKERDREECDREEQRKEEPEPKGVRASPG